MWIRLGRESTKLNPRFDGTPFYVLCPYDISLQLVTQFDFEI